MTLKKRIDLVRILTIVQAIIPVVFLIAVALFMISLAISDSNTFPPALFLMFCISAFIFALAVSVGLPMIVLVALKKRKENWAIGAYVSLVVQIVAGGGLFSLLPIVSLVLLVNKEASAYIGMK